MNKDIDEQIRQDLHHQAKELDALVDGGLGDYLKLGFSGSFSWLMSLGYVIALLPTVAMFYCGYQFFTAAEAQQTFWGILLLISFNAQVATKLWIFMQTNRNILSRELRIMEQRLCNVLRNPV